MILQYPKEKWIIFEKYQDVYLNIETWYMTDKETLCSCCQRKIRHMWKAAKKSWKNAKTVNVLVYHESC